MALFLSLWSSSSTPFTEEKLCNTLSTIITIIIIMIIACHKFLKTDQMLSTGGLFMLAFSIALLCVRAVPFERNKYLIQGHTEMTHAHRAAQFLEWHRVTIIVYSLWPISGISIICNNINCQSQTFSAHQTHCFISDFLHYNGSNNINLLNTNTQNFIHKIII